METGTIKKINKLGKIGYIITKIGKIALLIATVACFVGAVIMCFVPEDAVRLELQSTNSAVLILNENIDLSVIMEVDGGEGFINIGNNEYKLIIDDEEHPITEKNVMYLSNIKWVLFAVVFVCIAAYAVMYFANKLCAYFKDCKSPFTEEISKEILNLAWSLIPISVIGSFIESLTESVLFGKFDIYIGFDLITVILILCVFMLSYIFKYGTKLQSESDETL